MEDQLLRDDRLLPHIRSRRFEPGGHARAEILGAGAAIYRGDKGGGDASITEVAAKAAASSRYDQDDATHRRGARAVLATPGHNDNNVITRIKYLIYLNLYMVSGNTAHAAAAI